jgi:hypothetical protein
VHVAAYDACVSGSADATSARMSSTNNSTVWHIRAGGGRIAGCQLGVGNRGGPSFDGGVQLSGLAISPGGQAICPFFRLYRNSSV